jgi:hypothetical protein
MLWLLLLLLLLLLPGCTLLLAARLAQSAAPMNLSTTTICAACSLQESACIACKMLHATAMLQLLAVLPGTHSYKL